MRKPSNSSNVFFVNDSATNWNEILHISDTTAERGTPLKHWILWHYFDRGDFSLGIIKMKVQWFKVLFTISMFE